MNSQAETLAKMFVGLGHPARIALVEQLDKKSVSQIASETGVKLPAMQRHVNTLLGLGLIEKTSGRRYRPTHLGQQIAKLVAQFSEVVPSFETLEKEQFKKHMQQGLVKFGSGLTRRDLAKLLEEVQLPEIKRRKTVD
jgi:DNA-binding MarR family transcriptional regulator